MGLCNFYLSLEIEIGRKKNRLLHLNKPRNEVKTCDNRKDKQQTEIIALKGVEFTCYYFSSFDQDEELQVKGWEL